MIRFRCPFCNRLHEASSKKIGEKMLCSCQETVRVPSQSWGSAKYRSVGDRLIEFAVYGGGGAFLGLCLGIMSLRCLSFFTVATALLAWGVLAGCAGVGFLAGSLGGERGIDWIGRKIRNRDSAV